METIIQFNKLYVIDSLGTSDYQTGDRLVWDTLMGKITSEHLGLEYWKAPTRDKFFGALEVVLTECASGSPQHYPIIHLEAHGTADKKGISLPNGECVLWDELAGYCRKINVASRNNLMLVCAMCHGLHAIKPISLQSITPFLVAIGPEEEVNAGEIEDGFSAFYLKVLDSQDIDAGMKELSSRFSLFLADRMFAKSFLSCINGSIGELSEKESFRPAFERLKAQFLMTDHPENQARFGISFEDILEASN